MLLESHGVIAWGADLEQAYLRLELVEHLAQIALAAERAGGVRPLPEAAVAPLLEARRKAGLGPGTPAGAPPGSTPPRAVVACAPSPTADVAVISPGGSAAPRPAEGGDLASIIREEVIRSLRGS